jgi:cell division transport system permease protein
MHALTYCLREAAAGLWRQRGSTLLSACTTGVGMLVLGVFLMLSFNLDRAVRAWSAAAEMTLYLRDDISAADRAEINRALAGSALVAGRTYVSKADALARFKRDFPDLAGNVAALELNPLPASIDVRLKPELAVGDAVESLAAQLRARTGVADIRYDRQWLLRLAQVAAAVGWAGWILGGILIAAAALTISTVVRLSLHARRDEVEIMQLMGAPVGLLRGPLVVEGLLHGAAGALLAVVVLYGGHAFLRVRVAASAPGFVESGWLSYLPWHMAVWLVLGGMVVGSLGGLVASRHVR